MWARIRKRGDGSILYAFNTHWCVCGENDLFGSAQTAAQGIADVRAAYGEATAPAVLTGDLNVFAGGPQSKALRYLTGENVDGKSSPVVFADTYTGNEGSMGGSKIDFVLATATAFSTRRSVVYPAESGSDHRAVGALLEVL